MVVIAQAAYLGRKLDRYIESMRKNHEQNFHNDHPSWDGNIG